MTHYLSHFLDECDSMNSTNTHVSYTSTMDMNIMSLVVFVWVGTKRRFVISKCNKSWCWNIKYEFGAIFIRPDCWAGRLMIYVESHEGTWTVCNKNPINCTSIMHDSFHTSVLVKVSEQNVTTCPYLGHHLTHSHVKNMLKNSVFSGRTGYKLTWFCLFTINHWCIKRLNSFFKMLIFPGPAIIINLF